ncbi:MAG: heparin lyase I family protein [Candidatus Dormibacteraceae bacterium]
MDLTQPGPPVGMSLPGCTPIASDTSSNPDPLPFWGSIQCQDASRYSYVSSGGDTHPTATGAAQPDDAYRRLTVFDGDNFYGARCELGLNDHRSGPTAFYHEGQRRVTYFSERLPSNFPLATNAWQTVMQMKQAQPSHDSGNGPILELQATRGQWVIASNWNILWQAPAQANVWTRFAWDVYYSQDPSKGWIQVSVDLNGDGDFNDPGERSPVIHGATLATEVAGSFNSSDGLAAGAPIPSHLRMGIYHDPAIPCPAPSGCSTEVDNVQVVG